MINFISVDDNEKFIEKVTKIIKKVMVNRIDYQIFTFTNYDVDFKHFANKNKGINIYLLDIMTTTGSGVDAARYIRETAEDRNATIIIVSSHEEFRNALMFNRLDIFDYICKIDKMEKTLIEDIKIILKKYYSNTNVINYDYQGITYFLSLNEIVYIEKEKESRKCIIRTIDKKDMFIYCSLSEIEDKLDSRFIRTHNSLIVNKENINYYVKVNNEIIFKNGDTTTLISRDKKKELFDCVGASN